MGRIDSRSWDHFGGTINGCTAFFAGLYDPRTGNAGPYDLLQMLLITLCTVLSGGEDCPDMAEFARPRLGSCAASLELELGAPSHGTFSRLFRLRDPEQFRDRFQSFMTGLAATRRGVVAKAAGKPALCMVFAWGREQRLVPAPSPSGNQLGHLRRLAAWP
jgi:hypothetical protein